MAPPTLTHEQQKIIMELADLFSLGSLAGLDNAIRAGTTDLTIREVIDYAHRRAGSAYGFSHTAAKIARHTTIGSIPEDLSIRMAEHGIIAALRPYRLVAS